MRVMIAAAALLAASCGQQGNGTAPGPTPTPAPAPTAAKNARLPATLTPEAVAAIEAAGGEDAFRGAFRGSFIENCVQSAKANSALALDFNPPCACAADKLIASKSIAELAGDLSAEDAAEVTMQCFAGARPQ